MLTAGVDLIFQLQTLVFLFYSECVENQCCVGGDMAWLAQTGKHAGGLAKPAGRGIRRQCLR